MKVSTNYYLVNIGKRSAKTLIYSLDMEEFTQLVSNQEEYKQKYNEFDVRINTKTKKWWC